MSRKTNPDTGYIALTDHEKAVLTYAYFHGIDLGDVYTLFYPTRKVGKSIAQAKSHFKAEARVKDYMAELASKDEIRMRRKGLAPKTGQEGAEPAGVDFTDVNEFIGYLNTQANTIEDERDKQRYLSMLADLLRFKEGATDDKNDIQRFYVQIKCSECPLHREAEKKLKSRKE